VHRQPEHSPIVMPNQLLEGSAMTALSFTDE